MAKKKRFRWTAKNIAGLAALAASLVLLGVLAARTVNLAPRVLEERRATPTPSPVYGNTLAVTPDPAAPTSYPVLKNGSSGEVVAEVQRRLQELGYYSAGVDGQYGAGTAEAVMAFQRANGLLADGRVGEETADALRSGNAVPFSAAEVTAAPTPPPEATPVPEVLKMGTSGDAVRMLQQRLQELGYYSGEVDGQYGGGTRDAVRQFQRNSGLSADGEAGSATQAALYASDARDASQTPTPRPNDLTSDRPYIRADGLPLLVNKEYPLAEDYEPWDLVEMNSYCDSAVVKIKYADTLAEREAVDALMVMLRAAQAEGIGNWQISAAYRTKAYQQRLLDNQISTYRNENGLSASSARKAALKLVAEPGTSEHHIGTCFDITVPGVSFKGTKQHRWLTEHCWDYGFILRYQEGKEAITGFTAEAWHYRWVGLEHARRMKEENLCLEEYIQRYEFIPLEEE